MVLGRGQAKTLAATPVATVGQYTTACKHGHEGTRYTAAMATPLFRRAALGSLVLAAAHTVLAAGSPAPEQRTVNQQRIVISVVDKRGTAVATLAPADLTIREDGNAREVLAVQPATDAMQIALLVDTSSAASRMIPDLRDSLRAFSKAIWTRSPETQIALYTFGDRPTMDADFSTSAVALNRRIDRLFAASSAGATFIDAVVEVADALRKRKAVRPVIVAFVDESGPDFSSRRHDHASDAAAAARASLWTVVRQGFGSAMDSPENRERSIVVGDVTTRSGGRNSMVFDGNALKVRFADIATQLLAQFQVTYSRPDSLIPPERLEVKLTDPDLRLAAPRWTGK